MRPHKKSLSPRSPAGPGVFWFPDPGGRWLPGGPGLLPGPGVGPQKTALACPRPAELVRVPRLGPLVKRSEEKCLRVREVVSCPVDWPLHSQFAPRPTTRPLKLPQDSGQEMEGESVPAPGLRSGQAALGDGQERREGLGLD